MPERNGKTKRWAFIPAAVLLIIGFLIGFSMEMALQYSWPLVMIGGGLFLIGKTVLKNKTS